MTLSFPRIEPNLGRLETPYRQSFLKSDALQATVVIGLSNLGSLAMIRSDFQSFGLSSKFYMFLGARFVVLVISILTIAILSTSSRAKHHDWAIASYMIAGVGINIFINSMVPPNYDAYIGVSIVLLNIYYFALFTPIYIRVSVSCLFSAIVVFQAFQAPFPVESKTIIAGLHFLTNVVGLFVSSRLYTHRRLSFKAHREETELKRKMSLLASLDSLTNIKNRRAFSEKAIEEFERAKRFNRPVSLIIADIDHFKNINDVYGHLTGDEAIRYCASILKEQIRKQDTVARIGGDEFGILLPETQLAESIAIGKRIQQSCAQKLTVTDEIEIYISLSLGIAEITSEDRVFEDLFKRADQLLYKVKKGGQNHSTYEVSTN